jgi:hypothetical protein
MLQFIILSILYDRRRKKRKSSSIRHKKRNNYSSDLSQPISSKAAEEGESAMTLDAKEIELEETDEQFYENTQFICMYIRVCSVC